MVSGATLFEEFVIALDSAPFAVAYRVMIGFALLPASSVIYGKNEPAWVPFLVLAVILLMLRVVPAIVRKLWHFSRASETLWFERRQLAKRYDSYQWRKLLWIGVGLCCFEFISGEFGVPKILISSFCLVTGLLGMVRWRAIISGTARVPRVGHHVCNRG